MAQERHDLALELMQIPGWGARPHLLPTKAPTLCELAGAVEAGNKVMGQKMRDRLKRGIDGVETSYCLEGCELSAETLRRIFRILFAFESSGLNSIDRRIKAMRLAGIALPIRAWKDGPEAELMWWLANQMIGEQET